QLPCEDTGKEAPLFQEVSKSQCSNLAHLQVNLGRANFGPVEHVSYFANLSSLVLLIEGDGWAEAPVRLPGLTELSIYWTSESHQMRTEQRSPLEIISSSWTLPSLHILHIFLRDSGGADVPVHSDFLEFLRSFGGSLTHLTYYHWRCARDQMGVQHIFNFCPLLQHFVTSWLAGHSSLKFGICHQQLRWLDIWTDDIQGTRRAIQRKINSTNVPALRGTRLLDIALFDETTIRLPLEVPPDIVGGSRYLRWQYPGLDIQHDGDALYRRDMGYLPPEDPYSDLDTESSSSSNVHLTSDPTYEYESVPSSPIWSSDESDDDENESQFD
ncbi:hypothetical protein PAXINDRAFT_17791, partial [Paxillus involutus ATCC 200175]